MQLFKLRNTLDCHAESFVGGIETKFKQATAKSATSSTTTVPTSTPSQRGFTPHGRCGRGGSYRGRYNFRLAGDHLFGKLLFTWLSLVVSMVMSFCAVLFPRGVLDEILNLIESVSEDFPSSFVEVSIDREGPLTNNNNSQPETTTSSSGSNKKTDDSLNPLN